MILRGLLFLVLSQVALEPWAQAANPSPLVCNFLLRSAAVLAALFGEGCACCGAREVECKKWYSENPRMAAFSFDPTQWEIVSSESLLHRGRHLVLKGRGANESKVARIDVKTGASLGEAHISKNAAVTVSGDWIVSRSEKEEPQSTWGGHMAVSTSHEVNAIRIETGKSVTPRKIMLDNVTASAVVQGQLFLIGTGSYELDRGWIRSIPNHRTAWFNPNTFNPESYSSDVTLANSMLAHSLKVSADSKVVLAIEQKAPADISFISGHVAILRLKDSSHPGFRVDRLNFGVEEAPSSFAAVTQGLWTILATEGSAGHPKGGVLRVFDSSGKSVCEKNGTGIGPAALGHALIHKGKLLVVGQEGSLLSLNLAEGSNAEVETVHPAWLAGPDLAALRYRTSAHLSIVGDRIVYAEGSKVRLLDIIKGESKDWALPRNSWVLERVGEWLYLVAEEGNKTWLTKFSVLTGDVSWEREFQDRVAVRPSRFAEVLLAVFKSGHAVGLNRYSGDELFRIDDINAEKPIHVGSGFIAYEEVKSALGSPSVRVVPISKGASEIKIGKEVQVGAKAD